MEIDLRNLLAGLFYVASIVVLLSAAWALWTAHLKPRQIADLNHRFSDQSITKKALAASDVKNCQLWCTVLCFSSASAHIRFAKSSARAVLKKSVSMKQTKAMTTAVTLMHEFIKQPKGGITNEK